MWIRNNHHDKPDSILNLILVTDIWKSNLSGKFQIHFVFTEESVTQWTFDNTEQRDSCYDNVVAFVGATLVGEK